MDDYVIITVPEILSLQTFLELHSIKELTLNRCMFSDKATIALCDLIHSNHVLTTIDLSQCSFDEYIKIDLTTIQSKPGLINVNLSDINIELKGLLNIFDRYSAHQLSSIVEFTPHSLDVGNGIIKYDEPLVEADANALVKSLRSKLPINRVQCQGLKNPSLKTLFSLYKFVASKRLLEINVLPDIIDTNEKIIHFEYSPKLNDRSLTNLFALHYGIKFKDKRN
ncbi:hypothetical protein GEMRC1_004982 [Eukaryota sp. GEM-RC1]